MSTPAFSPGQLRQYRQTARRRQAARSKMVKTRMETGWQVARRAAKLLREKYHATRVVVFGSLLSEARFTPWSDVDIAVWGLSPDQIFRAIGDVMDLTSLLEINLVDVNACSPSLLNTIEREGVEI
jgi:uncharacterized protein